MDACPSEAISKNENGIVLVEEKLCTGCKLCLTACPISALQFNIEKSIVEKCTLCPHLVSDKGLEPACVVACPTGALYFGETNNVINRIRERRIKSVFSLRGAVVYGGLVEYHQK